MTRVEEQHMNVDASEASDYFQLSFPRTGIPQCRQSLSLKLLDHTKQAHTFIMKEFWLVLNKVGFCSQLRQQKLNRNSDASDIILGLFLKTEQISSPQSSLLYVHRNLLLTVALVCMFLFIFLSACKIPDSKQNLKVVVKKQMDPKKTQNSKDDFVYTDLSIQILVNLVNIFSKFISKASSTLRKAGFGHLFLLTLYSLAIL